MRIHALLRQNGIIRLEIHGLESTDERGDPWSKPVQPLLKIFSTANSIDRTLDLNTQS